MSVPIGGSGDVKMGNVRSDNVSISIAGSGEATVWALNTLSLAVAGSSTANDYGTPRVTTTLRGAGPTRRLGASPL